MSVKIMSQVWEDESLTGTEKLILLSLADHANDEGVCYPSIARLVRRTGFSERAIQGAIKRLCDGGRLEINPNAGPKGCNVFRIKPPQEMHPAGDAPPQEMREPPQQVRQTPAGDAPEPSGTVIKTSNKDQSTPDPCFSGFWEVWPLARIGRKKAEAAFKRLSKANQRLAIGRCSDWARAWRAKYPTANDLHPTSYLNGHRWNDDFHSQQSHGDPEIERLRKLAGAR